MRVTENGRPCAEIVVGPDATWLQRHAGEELAAYLRRISGADVPVADIPGNAATRPGDAGVSILIGRPETNPAVAECAEKNLVHLSREYPGRDGFVMETVRCDDRDMLVLGGSTDRGTLYAVYALLEDVLNVGFFRDGEVIPKVPTVDLPDLHVTKWPRFSEREDGNGCIFHYTTSAWEWDEWQAELDWKAKRRANIIWPFRVGGDITRQIMVDWGVYPAKETPKPLTEQTLHERALDYAHKLGMSAPCILPGGKMPEAFYEKFPDSRVITMQWSEYEPYRVLHPEDPMFKQLIVDYVRHYRERYGTDHIYIAEFTSESRILDGVTDVQESRRIFARAVSDALKEADPDGVWAPSGWSFDLSADDPGNPWQANWTPEQVVDYLNTIDVPFTVWDLWSEEAEKYIKTDYYGGHRWGFGVLHAFGAGSFLHGDVQGLVDRVHALVNEPKAKNCDLFCSASEIIDFNSFYYELAAKLSWNPVDVTLERFVPDYCRKRYGEGGEALEEAWWLLVDTVYGPESGTVKIIMDPLYWFRPDLELQPGWPEDAPRTNALRDGRPAFIEKLRRAVELFAAQDDLLQKSDLARRDLVDIARQWVAERCSLAIIAMRDAFISGNAAALETATAEALSLLDDQTRLLATWPAYRLDLKIERERKKWGDDADRAIKHTHVWVSYNENEHSVPLRDYYRQDLDGLVADYYKVRVAAFGDLLRTKLSHGKSGISDEEFDALYTPIEERFIAEPAKCHATGEDPVDVVRALLDR